MKFQLNLKRKYFARFKTGYQMAGPLRLNEIPRLKCYFERWSAHPKLRRAQVLVHNCNVETPRIFQTSKVVYASILPSFQIPLCASKNWPIYSIVLFFPAGGCFQSADTIEKETTWHQKKLLSVLVEEAHAEGYSGRHTVFRITGIGWSVFAIWKVSPAEMVLSILAI